MTEKVCSVCNHVQQSKFYGENFINTLNVILSYCDDFKLVNFQTLTSKTHLLCNTVDADHWILGTSLLTEFLSPITYVLSYKVPCLWNFSYEAFMVSSHYQGILDSQESFFFATQGSKSTHIRIVSYIKREKLIICRKEKGNACR